MAQRFDITASYRAQVTTGAVTTIAAATATAGHLLALRNVTAATRSIRIRNFEVEFILTTAFDAAQEVGFDVVIARSYSAAHTNQTALDFTGNTGKKIAGTGGHDASTLTGRVAGTAALTAGTHTFDTNPIARGSVWCGAVGASMTRSYDFTSGDDFTIGDPGGIILRADEGLVVRNSILMGATGVGRWTFSFDYDEGVLTV